MGFDVTGLDYNLDMVLAARKEHPNIPIYHKDARSTGFEDNTFDTIFFPFHGIDYVYPDIYEAVAEAKRILKPGGVFIISSHNRFYIKRLYQFFDGNYTDQNGLMTYRTTYLDWFRLKRYFKRVRMIQRIRIAVSWKDANWKDWFYKLFPILNKSTYFVCQKI